MPDWTYQTVGRPLLSLLTPANSRSAVVGMLSLTSRLPGGDRLIDLLGHMRVAGQRTRVSTAGFELSGPVACGACIDPNLDATNAFERFGFGCLLVGPFNTPTATHRVERDDAEESILVSPAESRLTLDQARHRLSRRKLNCVRVILQCQFCDPEAVMAHVQQLGSCVDAVIVSSDIPKESLAAIRDTSELAILLHLPIDAQGPFDAVSTERGEVAGFFVDGATHENQHQRLGRSALQPTNEAIVKLRRIVGDDPFIMASGGVHEPADALQLVEAGSNAMVIDSGMVFGGPGLAKRINETLEARGYQSDHGGTQDETQAEVPVTRTSWFWIMAMGMSMVFGGLLATVIALTRVMLPYDESMLGMSRFELLAINDRLLDFMKHDRITLAGTMLSVGGLYSIVSWFAVRQGARWATVAVLMSAFLGFTSFFLFLGFGYFDPFHAFVTAVLFQFLLLAVFSNESPSRRLCYPDLHNDRAWRVALWGQLLFLLHGASLIVAGLVICSIGVTSVFVPEDLAFLCTTPDRLFTVNPQLVPLVAHDRATFGGMLISCGIVVGLTSLWGFRRGAAWIWWMLLICGLVPYLMTIWVHHDVGYVDLKHLMPAYGGLLGLLIGSALTYGYLVIPHRLDEPTAR